MGWHEEALCDSHELLADGGLDLIYTEPGAIIVVTCCSHNHGSLEPLCPKIYDSLMGWGHTSTGALARREPGTGYSHVLLLLRS